MHQNVGLRNIVYGMIAAALGIAALRMTYPVAMPLAFAMIIIAAAWPIKPWLSRHMPAWESYTLTFTVLIAGLGAFGIAVYFASAQAIQALFANAAQLDSIYAAVVDWAAQRGVPIDRFGSQRVFAAAQTAVSSAYSFVGYLGFILLLVMFGLPEVAAMQAKLRQEFEASTRWAILDTAEEIADKIRRYFGVTMVTSLLTGVCSALWSYATGLELALTWGVLNFLLNFVPVIGNIIGIIPPTIYALIQFGDPMQALLVFAGFVVLQLVISNFVYPLLQGHSLSLSPTGIIVSLAFWSWLWGIAGALIAIPLTAAIVIICEHFDSTRWLSRLLSRQRA